MALSSNFHLQNPINAKPTTFPHFYAIPQVPDHHFATSNPPLTPTSTFLQKAIMKEWKILQNNNLPNQIYVHVFEDRIDLTRAVIVGATGAPYHDCLFFFDIAFPPDYLNKPPTVCYRSFGLRINPNLYYNGKVCLSLLNTWDGPKWDGGNSTILQVLLSLQGLVLNEKPYYNEPWLFWRTHDKFSREYNDFVFVYSCRTMMFLLQNPPNGFEGFVVENFRNCGRGILTACKEYMHGILGIVGVKWTVGAEVGVELARNE